MNTYVIDIETDGLVSNKIHVMSVGYVDKEGHWQIKSTKDYDVMRDVMSNPDNIVVGHYFKSFDAVELERVLNFKIQAFIIDTLPLSWYVFATRKARTFGLEDFGVDFGIEKPKVDDWEGLAYEEYKYRCEEDVKINIQLWNNLKQYLLELYGSWEDVMKFIRYIMFKMDCVVHQQLQKCKVDVNKINSNLKLLVPLVEEKESALKMAMPEGKVIRTKPKAMYKKDKSISESGKKWFEILREKELPIDTIEIRDEANPSSTKQLKDWLFSIGWEPETFKDGSNGDVPQVKDGDDLCRSVTKLIPNNPELDHLNGLTILTHRIAVLKSFLASVDDRGYVIAGMQGLTNTLRLKHMKPIANLPKVTGDIKKALDKGSSLEEAIRNNYWDGQIIRECIVAPKGYELCGSDVVSLEDNTKRHYMWNYDPEYVTEQMEDGFDPHLSLALYAGAITAKEVDEHKLFEETHGKQGVSHKDIRNMYKQANYSCIYGVGAPKLSKATGLTQKEAKKLISDYWNRNWSIKHLPNDITTKVVCEQMWLQNPVNKFWYSVRSEKDIFSTLNQGTGSFVFDMWLKYMDLNGINPFLQYHDEHLSLSKIGEREKTKEIINKSIQQANDVLRLNILIEVDTKFGNNYAEVH